MEQRSLNMIRTRKILTIKTIKMQEQLITFETAALAKEKGFDVGVNTFYNKLGNILNSAFPVLNSKLLEHSVGNCCVAPTKSLLQKWLREIYGILVEPVFNYDNDKYAVRVHNSGKSFISTIMNELDNESMVFIYDTYEQALEAGLQEALRLITNKNN